MRGLELGPADVLIVGAGASGAVVARHLVAAGFSVTCLEQGDWVRPPELPGERLDYDALVTRRWNPDPNIRRNAADYPVDVLASDVPPVMFNGVGGSTILYNAVWPRMIPSDFRVRTLDGVADDWPFTYEELAPYYARVERDFGVSGLAGDPAYPPGPDFPLPPLPVGRFGHVAARGMNAKDWHWWPHPCAIASREHGHLKACVRLGTCMSGCPRGAKGSTDLTHWPDAIADGARLVTGARVRQITVDARGRASGADYVDRDGSERHAGKWDAFPVAGLYSHVERLAGRSFDQRFGAAFHRNLEELVGHAFDWDIEVEDLPLESNRVTLSDELRDGDGIPAPRIEYRLSQETRANLAFQVDRAREAHEAGGARKTFVAEWWPFQGWHLLRTARCGDDPVTSVVDGYGAATMSRISSWSTAASS